MIRMAWKIMIMATFACWAVAAAASAVASSYSSSSSSSSSPMDQARAVEGGSSISTPRLGYREIRFNTANATETTYGNFLKEIRNHVAAAGDVRHRIRVMRNPSTVPDSELFLLVVITNSQRHSVTFALKVTNLALDAYLTPSGSYFFRGATPNAASLLFTDAKESHAVPFGSDLESLQRESIYRERLELGMADLDRALTTLVRNEVVVEVEETEEVARSLLVVAQMVVEAAYFKYIQSMMSASIRTGVSSPPDSFAMALEYYRDDLPRIIQEANDGGVIYPLMYPTVHSKQTYMVVDNVKTIAPYISLMPYVCTPPAAAAAMLIRPVVGDAASTSADQLLQSTITTCEPPDTRTRIIGWNGLCADSDLYHKYNDTYPQVRLIPCVAKSSDDNDAELWDLNTNGTIVSTLYFCLSQTERGGRNATTDSCPETQDKLWKVSADDGTIKNLGTGQVVANDQDSMVFVNRSSTTIPPPAQVWRFTNIVEPRVTSIVGLGGKCLRGTATSYGSNVWVEECDDDNAEQKWALYVDGTVRPDANRDSCIAACPSRRMFGYPIIELTSCDGSASAQRWEFVNDGTILNLLTGRVMDVASSNPSLKTIILYPINSGLNKQWMALV